MDPRNSIRNGLANETGGSFSARAVRWHPVGTISRRAPSRRGTEPAGALATGTFEFASPPSCLATAVEDAHKGSGRHIG